MPKLFQYINYIDYNELIHKPIINGVILEGKLSLEDLGIQPAGNYAHLDANGKVPLEELPDDVFGQLQYQGIWNAELNDPHLPNVPEVKGQYWIVANGGTQFGQDWEKGDWIIAGVSTWQKIDNSDIVTSVNGMIGDVELTASNIPYDATKSIKEAIEEEHHDFSGEIAQLREDLQDEVERAEAVEDDLDDKIDVEIANRTTADTALQTAINSEISNRTHADEDLQDDIDDEVTRATAAETALQTAINSEITNRTTADAAIQTALENVLEGLNTEIAARQQEVQDRITADNTLDTKITTEKNRALTAEHLLQDAIDAEETRALAAESTLTTNLANEVTRATAADTALQTAVDTLDSTKANKTDVYTKAEVDGKLTGGMHFKGTVATYDDLPDDAEVGDMYNVLDTGANYAWNGTLWDKLSENIDLSSYATITYVDDEVSAEETRALSAESSLQTSIANEASARTTADNTLQTNITNERTRAEAAEQTLTTNLTQEITDRTTADTALDTKITTEKTRAQTAEGIIDSKVTQEITDRTSADTTLNTKIETETTARTNADTALGTRIDTLSTGLNQEILNRTTADNTLQTNITAEETRALTAEHLLEDAIEDEETRATGVEAQLRTDLTAETTRATTAEDVLQSNITTETTNRTNADTALQTAIDDLDTRIDDLEEDIQTDISTALSSIRSDLTSEVTRATTAEGNLQTALTTETARAQTAESTLITSISNEVTRATEAETELSNSIQTLEDTVRNTVIADITQLQSDLSVEIQDRIDGDSTIQSDLNTFKTTVYTKAEVDGKLTSLFKYKGCVNTESDLPASDNNVGDVYNVEDTGANYAWNGQSWDKLSEDIDLSGIYTKTEVDETFATKAELTALSNNYVLKAGDTMTGPLTINGNVSGALTTNAAISAGNDNTVYEAALKSTRKCENDSNRVNVAKTYVLSTGETVVSHNRGQEDSYILFDATKLKYGTGEQNGSRVSQVYDIMTSKDTFTKAEVQQLLAQFLIDLNMSQYATKEDLNNLTRTYVYTQAHASNTWVINHNLNNYPGVVIVDNNGTQITGSVWYADENNITISFTQPFAGRAYLN